MNKRKASKVLDLDQVLIMPEVEQRWLDGVPRRITKALKEVGTFLASDISDEQLRISPDGSAEIFATVKSYELTMPVARGDWEQVR